MQSPTLAVSRDRYDIESLTQKKPNGFKPTLLNAAAARSADSFVRANVCHVEGTRGHGCPRSACARWPSYQRRMLK